MPVHGNRRYVKLAWIGTVAVLGLASPAGAEVVTQAANRGVLAVARDGSPRVAYVAGRDLYVARRAGGVWRPARLARLPAAGFGVAQMVVERRGTVSVLALDAGGKWIVLVRGKRLLSVARASAANRYGPPGVTLDGRGRPVVAYGVRLPSGATYLRLVRAGADGRLRTEAITQRGFPSSGTVPAAMPVRVGRTIHVVEAVGATAIDWGPEKGAWVGQYLFASRFGATIGPVAAVAARGALYAALTLDAPQFGESNVVALVSRTTQESTVVFPHALLAGLAAPRTGVEVAANDFVTADAGTVFAGLVAAPGLTAELDGRIDGYAVIEEGTHMALLAHPDGLEWFGVPAVLPVAVRLEAATGANRSAALTGSVTGSAGGDLDLYRETPTERTLVARTALASDGSFAAFDPSPQLGSFYRAVYHEPTTGMPYAALLRSPCCATR
jgi:hypothetical protein